MLRARGPVSMSSQVQWGSVSSLENQGSRAMSSTAAGALEAVDDASPSGGSDSGAPCRSVMESRLKPKEVMKELDRHIIGQSDAKRAVAVALRNRWRRQQLPEDLRQSVTPKNILMIGPTGCGKTEIARRLASLVQAPFIKVEATKFTEVGFHGRDVDTIIRDLMDTAVALVKKNAVKDLEDEVRAWVDDLVLDQLLGDPAKSSPASEEAATGSDTGSDTGSATVGQTGFKDMSKSFKASLEKGELDEVKITVNVPIDPKKGGGEPQVGPRVGACDSL